MAAEVPTREVDQFYVLRSGEIKRVSNCLKFAPVVLKSQILIGMRRHLNIAVSQYPLCILCKLRMQIIKFVVQSMYICRVRKSGLIFFLNYKYIAPKCIAYARVCHIAPKLDNCFLTILSLVCS